MSLIHQKIDVAITCNIYLSLSITITALICCYLFSASDYKKSTVSECTSSAELPPSSSAETATTSAFNLESDFFDIFGTSNMESWNAIVNDPLLSLSQSSCTERLLQYARMLKDKHESLKDRPTLCNALKSVFNVSALVSERNRERCVYRFMLISMDLVV
jgi:hypothetical protein